MIEWPGGVHVGQLRVVIEVRTKLMRTRLDDKQRRSDVIRDDLSNLGRGPVGVWMVLAEGAWSQS